MRLVRSAEVDASNITVEVQGSKAILKGKVRSWAERKEAERTAWLAPGITSVDNQISLFLTLLDIVSVSQESASSEAPKMHNHHTIAAIDDSPAGAATPAQEGGFICDSLPRQISISS